MRKILLIAIIMQSACGRTARIGAKSEIEQSKLYKVYKIDSINNIYLIYARKGNDSLFKIASEKTPFVGKKKIEINQSYPFTLRSLFIRNFAGKYDLSPKASSYIGGVMYHGTTITIEKDSITDIFDAENIKGLFFIGR